MTAAHTPGPYSVHPYTEIQGRKTLTRDDGTTWETAAISIGAGGKLLGEVFYRTDSAGYPFIDSEEEMRAVAALWIAAPELLDALEAALAHFGPFAEITINGQHDPEDVRVTALIRAAIAKATGAA